MNEIATFRGGKSPQSGRQESAEAEFLAKVGERVRVARARKGISRKVLSNLSGVSLRYLAQLEGGDGNISIALLKRVAEALDHRIEWLVGEDDPWNSEVMAAASLFRTATREQRAKAFEILDPQNASVKKARRIALIGLRGAGKSTLGRLSAAALEIPFVELNEEIEQVSGMPVTEVMALYGQEGYRRLEREAVERVASTHDVMMLAVAGGIVSEPDNFNCLLRHFHTIWLKARPEEHMGRVRAQGDTRPMAGNPAAMDELKAILTSREALYARADAQLNTSGRSLDASLEDLIGVISERGFLRV
jgi:XRE family transcriptional regulator, aerobic/anaerobic benzoate catabolism transcriptional regulator